jgi:hypothetical protein
MTDKTYQPSESSSPTNSDAPSLESQCPSASVSDISLTWGFTSIPVNSGSLTQAATTGIVSWTTAIPLGTYDITIIGTFPDLRKIRKTFRLTVGGSSCASETITSQGDAIPQNYLIA